MPYEGDVYNLVLGTPEELEERDGATTMIANGVVVGDSRMQDALKLQRTEEAARTISERPVSPEFYVDYLGAQWRKAKRAAAEARQ